MSRMWRAKDTVDRAFPRLVIRGVACLALALCLWGCLRERPKFIEVPEDHSAGLLAANREPNVQPVARLEAPMGRWPVEERNYGFEEVLSKWRSLEVRP